MTDKLREAAQAIVDRWDSPAWGGSSENLRHTGEYIAELRAALAQHSVYQLPDDLYPDSKCWVDGTYAERVEWLHTMYESSKQTLNVLLGQQDAQAVERVGDPVTITRLATLVDEETQRILADSLDLIKQINYMVGIAERGTGKKCPDGERPEVFLLDYVKSLEAALSQQDAQAVVQEPCAVVKWQTGGPVVHIIGDVQAGDLLYRAAPTPPAQRVMLTDEEIEDLARGKSGHSDFARDIIEAYERKNGIK